MVWTSSDCGRCNQHARVAHRLNDASNPFGVSDCKLLQGGFAQVRCCADAVNQEEVATGPSCKTCSELGWPAGFGRADVCGESEVVVNGNTTVCLGSAVDFAVGASRVPPPPSRSFLWPVSSLSPCFHVCETRLALCLAQTAQRVCTYLGARLCDTEELAANEAAGTGCSALAIGFAVPRGGSRGY